MVQGLLTVDPGQRLRMADLKRNSWVRGSQSFPQTPLMTPDVLLAGTSAEKSLQTTFNAFHKAQREGFRLQDVLNAKLAQRRRMKKSSSENNSPSSSFSSDSSTKNKTAEEPKKVERNETESSVFSFESTSSGGMEKGPAEGKKGRKKRERKVYVQTRQSERIRRIRLEIDDDPVCFLSLPNRTKKRKLEASDGDAPKAKAMRTEATTKRGRKKR